MIRNTLLGKILSSYLLILFLGFVLLTSLTYKGLERFLINEKTDLLHKEATVLANQYISAYHSGNMSNFNMDYLVNVLDHSLDTRIWFVNKDGFVISDSRSNTTNIRPLNIKALEEDILYRRYSEIDNFYGFFEEDMISVGTPIIVANTFQGAVFFHTELSTLQNRARYVYYVAALILFFIMIISLSFIYYFGKKIINPLNEMNKTATKYANGDFDTTIKVDTDDEIGRLANSLNNMAYELSKIEEFRRSFIANISHDFRSPLTSIKGYVGAILDGTISYESQDKYLNIVLTETDRLNKLTSDILFLTRMETSGLELHYITFDIHKIIREVTALFEQKCLAKNITITLMLDNVELYVFADIDRVKQVIYNLFDNAIKFSDENSVIIIETTELHSKVYTSIKDFGQGIPQKDLKYIWDRFYKSDPSRGKDKKGTGLGLSIVKEIVKAHDENIKVFSTEGVGSEFVFTLTKSTIDP
ncbi:signal transduction histidine kinase [Natranaerovirga hydrolytica]|uniref:histidine kinase n=1 Tax=Natranaerovirga hydrolytica TaxID=680378 RepID=A0A4R1M9K0_9FIRM|nr:HAMP domain-containing sensor histidine kinase [Natranaerovirga hydrolytica]TCK89036.1 signal transduction histidine kinase [Natranaerovirga hydrolytica]